jgi:GntR family phosphonate transport system transcriptional regulator
MPNESQLAERFGVNRHTLRQAVRQLSLEGHLHVVQGKGTFVRELVLDYALRRRTRMSENLAQAGERGRRELLAHDTRPAAEWAAVLGLTASQPVEWLQTRTVVRGRPISLSATVYPSPRCAGIAQSFATLGSISAALHALGVADYVRARSVVSSRLPSAVEADLLARPAASPVLVVQFHSLDQDGLPIEAGRTVFAADAVQLQVEHER